ncbi:hypothetical protein, partial [Caldilinea sp.]|uniref:hypothetical protein n=1 Tax=Caldilinea sp. TaxID=2293560 RepID=UPI001B2DA2FE
VVPVTQTVVVTEVVPVEQVVPVTQTVVVTEVVPGEETLSVRESEGTTSVPSRPVTNWLQLSPPYSEPTPLPITGLAMYYAPQVMDRVELYRERVNQIEVCEECIGRVALLRAGDLGRLVWIQVGDGIVEGPFQVLDVAARHHIPDLLRRNWVVDVDYETARRWGMRGPIEVTVFAEPPEKVALRMSENAQKTVP